MLAIRLFGTTVMLMYWGIVGWLRRGQGSTDGHFFAHDVSIWTKHEIMPLLHVSCNGAKVLSVHERGEEILYINPS